MQETKKKFEQLLKVLKLEKEADLKRYQEAILEIPLSKKRKEGVVWHPLNILQTGFTYGDRVFVLVERTQLLDTEHRFRAGMPITLFTTEAHINHPRKNAVVHYVKRNRMKIILNNREIPEWLKGGSIGIEVAFDERTYQEMERALKFVMNAKGNRLAELRDILTGVRQPKSLSTIAPLSWPHLNHSQAKAIESIRSTQDVALIHGPPGTGKTTTLVHAIKAIIPNENTVLVTAPSNTAVDLLTERLDALDINVVRIGNISRVDERIMEHTLDALLANHPESKNIKKIKIQAAELRRKVNRYKRKLNGAEWNERRQMRNEAKELSAWANQMEERLIDQILSSAQVITCTLVGSRNSVLENRHFQTVFIDEAAQGLEPATWIPITMASKVIMAGDPFQLPPTVKSLEAQKKGLSITLLEKCIGFMEQVNLLKIQYRMNRQIMGFSNLWFYNNALKAAPEIENHLLTIENNQALTYIDTAGCGFEEKRSEKRLSRFNPDEFQILCEHLYQMINDHREKEIDLPSIALISPYREQVIHMTQLVAEDAILSTIPININTIDGFQGQEQDVIYISLVRSNDKGEIGFLKDYRRMNVAMTRARKKLVVIGDSATIGQDPFYLKFIEYCEQENAYATAWEYMQ